MKSLRIKEQINLVLLFIFLSFFSCDFEKSNSVYDSYKKDKTLVFYQCFNNSIQDKKNDIPSVLRENILYQSDRFGNENSAAKFLNEHYVSFGDVLDSVFTGDKSRFSISLWIKTGSNNVTLIGKNADSNCNQNEREFNIKISDENKVQFIWLYNNDQFNGYRIVENSSKLKKDKWQNLIITYNGQSNEGDGLYRINMFVNGEKQNVILKERKGKLGFMDNKKSHLGIGTMVGKNGYSCTNKFFKGSMDDIMIFSRILSKNEIKHISSMDD